MLYRRDRQPGVGRQDLARFGVPPKNESVRISHSLIGSHFDPTCKARISGLEALFLHLPQRLHFKVTQTTVYWSRDLQSIRTHNLAHRTEDSRVEISPSINQAGLSLLGVRRVLASPAGRAEDQSRRNSVHLERGQDPSLFLDSKQAGPCGDGHDTIARCLRERKKQGLFICATRQDDEKATASSILLHLLQPATFRPFTSSGKLSLDRTLLHNFSRVA